jgi:DNA mismatch endonuclease (patch repair protein)
MSRIRGKNTGPEVMVRRFLFANGFRFRIHARNLPGTPDVVLPAYRSVVMVNGCFWHGHTGCREGRVPTTNADFWAAKIGRNQQRDEYQIKSLKAMGWNVIVVWACGLRGKSRQSTLVGILKQLTSHNGAYLPD